MKIRWIVVGVIGISSIVSLSLLSIAYRPIFSYTVLQSPSAPSEDEFVSVEKAQEKVLFRIIEPRYLPTDFTFLGVLVSEERITLTYESSNGRRITISEWKYNGNEHQPYPGEKEVTINGIKGWFSIPGPYNLYWNCDNLTISLTADLSGGSKVVMDELIKIAESIQC